MLAQAGFAFWQKLKLLMKHGYAQISHMTDQHDRTTQI